MSAITSFLEGTGSDHRGRNISEVLNFDNGALEAVHDYIQWLFPLPETSAFNPFAPVLTASDIEALKRSPRVQESLEKATARMLQFYRQNTNWLTAVDHNHLRITRIIRSLALLQGKDKARLFHDQILQITESAGRPVASQALNYWYNAAHG